MEKLTHKTIEEMTGAELFGALVAMTWTVKKYALTKGFSFAEVVKTKEHAEEIAGGAWLHLQEMKNATDEAGEPVPDSVKLFRACWREMLAIYRNEVKHVSALSIDDETNNAFILTLTAGAIGERHASAPQRVEYQEEIAEAIASQEDAAIIRALAAGYTQKEIAAAFGVSQKTISTKLTKIKERRKAYKEATQAR